MRWPRAGYSWDARYFSHLQHRWHCFKVSAMAWHVHFCWWAIDAVPSAGCSSATKRPGAVLPGARPRLSPCCHLKSKHDVSLAAASARGVCSWVYRGRETVKACPRACRVASCALGLDQRTAQGWLETGLSRSKYRTPPALPATISSDDHALSEPIARAGHTSSMSDTCKLSAALVVSIVASCSLPARQTHTLSHCRDRCRGIHTSSTCSPPMHQYTLLTHTFTSSALLECLELLS